MIMFLCKQKSINVSVITIPLARVKVNNNIIEKVEVVMCNKDIREYAEKHNVKLWQIANKLGINDGNLSRKLRFELAEEKKAEIYKIVDELSK